MTRALAFFAVAPKNGRVRTILIHVFGRSLNVGFERLGVRVFHPKATLDEDATCATIDAAFSAVCESGYDPTSVRRLFSRIVVEVVERPAKDGPEVACRAEWTGGFFDVGRVEVGKTNETQDHLGRSLVALALLELDKARSPVGIWEARTR